MSTDAELKETLVELMGGWNQIMGEARKKFTSSTDEELFEITKGAMNHALGIQTVRCPRCQQDASPKALKCPYCGFCLRCVD